MSATLFGIEEETTAVLSPDGLYRYALTRTWGARGGAVATFVMLNPSTADAAIDDATIVRCRNFAKSWLCHGLRVVNLYALRSTNPKGLWRATDPIGPSNDDWLMSYACDAAVHGWPLVAAWGMNAKPARVARVLGLPGMGDLQSLGITKSGAPRHPLYLRSDSTLRPWPSERAA